MVDVTKEELVANDGASLVEFIQSGTGGGSSRWAVVIAAHYWQLATH